MNRIYLGDIKNEVAKIKAFNWIISFSKKIL